MWFTTSAKVDSLYSDLRVGWACRESEVERDHVYYHHCASPRLVLETKEKKERKNVKSSVRNVYSFVLFYSSAAGLVTRPAKTGTLAIAQPVPRVERRSDS